jgi:zinc finger SWIM domain-containing protein 3
VVAFDTIYKKNRYGNLLVIFSGYNHHGETTIFACALICDETTNTYKWVLNMFSKAMYDKYPKVVVTDADKSMREAIRVVFPNSKHRICSWHLQLQCLFYFKCISEEVTFITTMLRQIKR